MQIYDPFYCNGEIIDRFNDLGFTQVYNKPEDFYAVLKGGRVPNYSVLVSNPPFSGNHIRRLLEFAVSRPVPYMLLLPSNVFLRPWFNEVMARSVTASKQIDFFLAPHERYSFEVPSQQQLLTVPSTGHIPMVTMWFIGGLCAEQKADMYAHWVDKSNIKINRQACLALTTEELPRRIKKLLPFTQRRAAGKKGKKITKQKLKDILALKDKEPHILGPRKDGKKCLLIKATTTK